MAGAVQGVASCFQSLPPSCCRRPPRRVAVDSYDSSRNGVTVPQGDATPDRAIEYVSQTSQESTPKATEYVSSISPDDAAVIERLLHVDGVAAAVPGDLSILIQVLDNYQDQFYDRTFGDVLDYASVIASISLAKQVFLLNSHQPDTTWPSDERLLDKTRSFQVQAKDDVDEWLLGEVKDLTRALYIEFLNKQNLPIIVENIDAYNIIECKGGHQLNEMTRELRGQYRVQLELLHRQIASGYYLLARCCKSEGNAVLAKRYDAIVQNSLDQLRQLSKELCQGCAVGVYDGPNGEWVSFIVGVNERMRGEGDVSGNAEAVETQGAMVVEVDMDKPPVRKVRNGGVRRSPLRQVYTAPRDSGGMHGAKPLIVISEL